jgi:segregation and condensation protein B
MENSSKLSVVEALILASPDPLPARKLADMVSGLTPSGAGQAVAQLNNRYMEAGCSFRVRELAGGFQFYVVPEFAGYVQELFARRRKMRLTRASLETMAIVAYRQPVTKTEIEHIRGVATDGVVHHLLEEKLITIQGRAKTVGKPLQYGTTDEFLKFFGLASLSHLPKMSEIEELLAENESTSQTQLELAESLAEEPSVPKLNVADGTYDPASDENDEPAAVSIAESSGEPVGTETELVGEEMTVEDTSETVETDSELVTDSDENLESNSDESQSDVVEDAMLSSESDEVESPVLVETTAAIDEDEVDDFDDEPAAPVVVDMDSTG